MQSQLKGMNEKDISAMIVTTAHLTLVHLLTFSLTCFTPDEYLLVYL